MKRLIACLLLLMMPLCAFGEEETEEVFASSAKAAVLIESQSGRILYENNAYQPLPMASTTKVMTALLALEYGKLNETVTAGKNAFGVPGTSIYLSLGEQMTLRNMLYGLMLASGNDAAVAIAEHIGGTVDGFCQMMTQRAKELGCKDTLFKTPHGLPNNEHHTTAYDLALIAREAMTHPLFREIVSTTKANIPWEGRTYDRVLNNKNRLLTDYEGATGIKTGYTKAAGRCLVFSAQREGMEVIGVVLNCGDWFNEAERIMDSGFENYHYVSFMEKEKLIQTIPVINGEKEQLEAILGKDLGGVFEKTQTPTLQVELLEDITGGVEQGQQLGVARLYENEILIDEAPIIAKETVKERTFRRNIERTLKKWLSDQW